MTDPKDATLPPILPAGTQVVSLVEVRGPDGRPVHPRGAMCVVSRSPSDAWHAYRVRFPDGFEASLGRPDMTVLAHYQRPPAGAGPAAGVADRLAEHDLYGHVILRVVVGSRAYGLHGDASDTDRRGVYLPPADRQWSLFGVPEQLGTTPPRRFTGSCRSSS